MPAVLERELKRFADNLRVPVSNLVRTILEDAVSVADAATENVEERLKKAAEHLEKEREKLKKRMEHDPLDGIVAFQDVTLAVPAACAKCAQRRCRAARARTSASATGRRAACFVCESCLTAGVTSPQEPAILGGRAMNSVQTESTRSDRRREPAESSGKKAARRSSTRSSTSASSWAEFGVSQGKQALAQSAKTLEKVAKSLDDLQRACARTDAALRKGRERDRAAAQGAGAPLDMTSGEPQLSAELAPTSVHPLRLAAGQRRDEGVARREHARLVAPVERQLRLVGRVEPLRVRADRRRPGTTRRRDRAAA